jgi:hypothetical protein
MSIEGWEGREKKKGRRGTALLYRYGYVTVPVGSHLKARVGRAL